MHTVSTVLALICNRRRGQTRMIFFRRDIKDKNNRNVLDWFIPRCIYVVTTVLYLLAGQGTPVGFQLVVRGHISDDQQFQSFILFSFTSIFFLF